MKKYLDFLKESLNKRFIIGDHVIITDDYMGEKSKNKKGIIVCYWNVDDSYDYGVKVEEPFNGHNLDGNILTSNGYWFPDNLLISDPEFQNLKKGGEYETMKMSDNIKKIGYDFIFPIYSKLTYIDSTDNNDYISYLTVKKSKLVPDNERWTSKLRQPMKIGRFLQSVYNYTGQNLENLVNMYKSRYDIINNRHDIKIVEGEDIRFWYSENNYNPNGGTLNNSCMKDLDDQYRFDIYCENPNKIKMAIILDNNKKLMGRALIWKLDDPHGTTMMDRIYTIDDFLVDVFEDYRRKKGWVDQQFGLVNSVSVKLKRDYGDPDENPYMDTMKYFYPEFKTLSSQTDLGYGSYYYTNH